MSTVYLAPLSVLVLANRSDALSSLLLEFCTPLFEHWKREHELFGTRSVDAVVGDYLGRYAAKIPVTNAVPQIIFAIGARGPPSGPLCVESVDSLPLPRQLLDLLDPAKGQIVGSIGIDHQDIAPNSHAAEPPGHPYAGVGPWLQSLFILETFRGSGLAGKLLDFALDLGRTKLELKWLWLYTDADGPYAMGEVYEKRGFKLIEDVPCPWLGKVPGAKCSALRIMRIDWGWND